MTGLIRPRRSMLYIPGINERALEKAKSLAADGLIFDLEDSVAPDVKAKAREMVCARTREGGYGGRELIVRVNAIECEWGADDLAAAAVCGADGVLIPKVNVPDDLIACAKKLKAAGAPDSLQIWAMIETPLGVLNVQEIAALGTDARVNLTGFILGTNDLLKETRARFTPDRASMLGWLSQTVLAARAYGLDVIDGVYNDLQDEDGLRAECEQGCTLGMDGKTLIHPNQLARCNEIFSPAPEEVSRAHRIIAAFAKRENAHKGVIAFEGQMVERLHEEMARRTVAIDKAIAMTITGQGAS